MSEHHAAHFAKHGAEAIKRLEPLAERKSPAVAFVAGLLLGSLGVAIYLRSFKDFFICMVLFVLLSLMLPGLGSIIGWLFAPVYGAWRAHTSNDNLGL